MADTGKTLLLRGQVKTFQNDKKEEIPYIELRVTVNGIPIRLYTKNGDATAKEILMSYFKE